MNISGEVIMQEGNLRGVLKSDGALAGRITTSASLSGRMLVPSAIINNDYEELIHKPQINSVELNGNKSFDDLGMSGLSNLEIEFILRT